MKFRIDRLIGCRIETVLQLPWQQFEDTSATEIFLKLVNGEVVPLVFVESYSEIIEFDQPARLIPVEFLSGQDSDYLDNRIINELIIDDSWPTYGVALGDSETLRVDSFTPAIVGAVVESHTY